MKCMKLVWQEHITIPEMFLCNSLLWITTTLFYLEKHCVSQKALDIQEKCNDVRGKRIVISTSPGYKKSKDWVDKAILEYSIKIGIAIELELLEEQK